MAYLDHIHACNRHDLTGFTPFEHQGEVIGWVRPGLARDIADAELGLIRDHAGTLRFAAELADFAARTAALDAVAQWLDRSGRVSKLRGEKYPVLARWGATPLADIDRAVVEHLGLRAFGLHVNGFVRSADGGLSLWVGRRSADRSVAPGKLDNLVAGGQPSGLTLSENLVKEAAEEAGMDAAMALTAKPVGIVSYTRETPVGLKPDTLFVYDLEVPVDFIPRNTDGEVEVFELWPVERVARTVRDTDHWKINVNLVVIDFLIRHGWLTAENEPDYPALARGVRGVIG